MGTVSEIYEKFIDQDKGHTERKADFRCSGVWDCVRSLVYDRQGMVQEETGGMHVKRAAHKGNLFHADMRKSFEAKGILLAAEQFRAKVYEFGGFKFNIGGHLDNLIQVDKHKVVIENKSKRSFLFTRIEKEGVTPAMRAQTSMYIDIWAADYGIVVVENRDTGDLYEEIVQPEPAFMEKILKRLTFVLRCQRDKALPKRPYPKDSTECRYCPFFTRCWKEARAEFPKRPAVRGDVVLKPKPKTVKTFNTIMADYSKYRELKLEAEVLYAQVRLRTQAMLEKHRTDSVSCGGRLLSRSLVTTSRPDGEVIAELVEKGTIPTNVSQYYLYNYKDQKGEEG